jgi:NADP-dependent 3-hydroxy acid dehydrogenase YdfG
MAERLKVLVTGASSGIGRATAVKFARRGHEVFAAARRDDVLAGLADIEPNIRPVGVDVADGDSVQRAWSKIEAETGGTGVDVLVNNAGFALAGPVEVLPDEAVRRQFDTNVFGVLNITRAVLPAMRVRGSGRIVNVSSLLGRVTFPLMGVYGATKYAVEALSDALRQELRGLGIRVVLVEPSFVATNLGSAADAETGRGPVPEAYQEIMETGTRYLATQLAKGIPADKVATTIANAAESRNPRTRYVVPGTMRPLITTLTALPDKVADKAKLRATR